MKIFKTIHEIENVDFGLTIGNFDGFHLGHQQLLKEAQEECRRNNLKLVVLTFNPHPVIILHGKENYLLNTPQEKRAILEKAGVKSLIEMHFDRDFSTLAPAVFLDKHITTKKGLKKVFVGHDFALGANKAGDSKFLENYFRSKSIEFIKCNQFKMNNDGISSSRIRESLKIGKVDEASIYLGRDFFISGPVIKGVGRGKKIGFPTANVLINKERIIPSCGVYATITDVNGMKYNSVTNIGKNPTFGDIGEICIETHILDFSNDIYGETLNISFKKHLRNEQKFKSVNDLISQIKVDIQTSKKLFEGLQ